MGYLFLIFFKCDINFMSFKMQYCVGVGWTLKPVENSLFVVEESMIVIMAFRLCLEEARYKKTYLVWKSGMYLALLTEIK